MSDTVELRRESGANENTHTIATVAGTEEADGDLRRETCFRDRVWDYMTPHTFIIWARRCDLLQSTSQTRWHLARGTSRNCASACYGRSSFDCVRLVTLAMRSLRLGHPWNHIDTPNLRIAPRDRAHNRHIDDRRVNDRRDSPVPTPWLATNAISRTKPGQRKINHTGPSRAGCRYPKS